jgi:hypothetical protein
MKKFNGVLIPTIDTTGLNLNIHRPTPIMAFKDESLRQWFIWQEWLQGRDLHPLTTPLARYPTRPPPTRPGSDSVPEVRPPERP